MIATISPQNSRLKETIVKKEFSSSLSFLTIPNSIYNKMIFNLQNGEKITLIINSENDNCSWTISTFLKNHKNEVRTVSVKKLIECEKLKQIKTLYKKLNKIEKNNSLQIAEKYLEGYLEYKNITLNGLTSPFLLSA
jgi:hypothetical protein